MASSWILNKMVLVTWYGGAFSLLAKSGHLLLEARVLGPGRAWHWAAFGVGIVAGALRAKPVFGKTCGENSRRIEALANPRWWQFYRPRFFLLLLLMVGAGVLLSRWAHGSYLATCLVLTLDLSVGIGLFFSGLQLFRRRIPERPHGGGGALRS